jgi:hypothetical protein
MIAVHKDASRSVSCAQMLYYLSKREVSEN